MIKYLQLREMQSAELFSDYICYVCRHVNEQMEFLFNHYEQRVAKPLEAEQLQLFNQTLDGVCNDKVKILLDALDEIEYMVEDNKNRIDILEYIRETKRKVGKNGS